MIFRYFLLVLMLVFLQNCTYNKADVVKPLALEPGCDTTKVTYGLSVMPIIEKNCYECHSKTATHPSKVDYALLDDFDVLRDYATKPSISNPAYTSLQAYIRHITLPGMPFNRAKLSECDIRKIEIWIKQGAPKN